MQLGLRFQKFVLLFAMISLSGTSVLANEDWKGKEEDTQIAFGGLTGMGIIDSSVGYTILGTISKKIISDGFVPDINNSVWIEGAVGPVFLSGATALSYNAHLRWDFVKDSFWTLYGLGGVGGNYLSVTQNNFTVGRGEFFPRFGAGVFYKISPAIRVRGEVAHNLIAVGLNIPI